MLEHHHHIKCQCLTTEFIIGLKLTRKAIFARTPHFSIAKFDILKFNIW